MVTKPDIQESAGSLQLCAGQISGIEAAVYTVDSLFQQDETDQGHSACGCQASNAFNSLNHLSALHKIR